MTKTVQARSDVPRHRADALTDGLFAIVMTILVLDLHLPAHARYRSATDLWTAIDGLGPQVMAYAISFFVVASFWRGHVGLRSRAEFLPAHHTLWWMLHLFVITLVPVATGIVGNFGHLAPAVWAYSATMLLAALTSWRMGATYPQAERTADVIGGRIKLGLLAVAALLAAAISLVSPSYSMLAFLLMAATPWVVKLVRRTVADMP